MDEQDAHDSLNQSHKDDEDNSSGSGSEALQKAKEKAAGKAGDKVKDKAADAGKKAAKEGGKKVAKEAGKKAAETGAKAAAGASTGGMATAAAFAAKHKKAIAIGVIALAFLTIFFLFAIFINILSTVKSFFDFLGRIEHVSSVNTTTSVEYMLDAKLVDYINNPYGWDAKERLSTDTSPFISMYGHWEEAEIRKQFEDYLVDRFSLDRSTIEGKYPLINVIGTPNLRADRNQGTWVGDQVKKLWPDTWGGQSHLKISGVKTKSGKETTIEGFDMLNSIQWFRETNITSRLTNRLLKNQLMLRQLGITNRSIITRETVEGPKYQADNEENFDIVKEAYIQVTDDFLTRFENYIYQSTEASIACLFSRPKDMEGLTDVENKNTPRKECQNQFDVLMARPTLDDPTLLPEDQQKLRLEFIEKSFDIKNDDGYEYEDRQLELAKIERRYTDEVLSYIVAKGVKDFYPYWYHIYDGGERIDRGLLSDNLKNQANKPFITGRDFNRGISNRTKRFEENALAALDFNNDRQLYMIYSDTIKTAISENNLEDASNTTATVLRLYTQDFAASPFSLYYLRAGIPNSDYLNPCLNDDAQPELTDTNSGDSYELCPEKRLRKDKGYYEKLFNKARNKTMYEIIEEEVGETLNEEVDIEATYNLARVLTDSITTPLVSGGAAFEAMSAGEIGTDYELNLNRSTIEGGDARDGGLGGGLIRYSDHDYYEQYLLYDVEIIDHDTSSDYFEMKADLSTEWTDFKCDKQKDKKNFNLHFNYSGNIEDRADPCSLFIAVSRIGSFKWSDQLSHQAVVSEKLILDMPSLHDGGFESNPAVEPPLLTSHSLSSGVGSPCSNEGGFIKPASGGVGSPFGMRLHPKLGVYRLHSGLDFPAGNGTPVWAAASGTVIKASVNGGYGNYVEIDHGVINGQKTTTAYAHLSAYGVRVGSVVSQGEYIGSVGSTGLSTGPHLHFEIKVNGTPIDPAPHISGDGATCDSPTNINDLEGVLNDYS